MKSRIAFWISRVVSTRAETGSSAQSTDTSDQVRKATIAYASHGVVAEEERHPGASRGQRREPGEREDEPGRLDQREPGGG